MTACSTRNVESNPPVQNTYTVLGAGPGSGASVAPEAVMGMGTVTGTGAGAYIWSKPSWQRRITKTTTTANRLSTNTATLNEAMEHDAVVQCEPRLKETVDGIGM